jgi:hypothetical protein
VKLKKRVLATASVLGIAGGVVAVGAPGADAAITPIGGCTGQLGLGTFYDSANVLTPLGDQTALGVTIKAKLLKDLVAKTAIAGDCSSATRPGDPINPPGGLVSPLTPKALSAKLVGNASCASGATAEAVDATAAATWPPNGKISWTMSQLNALSKPYQIQANVVFTGENPAGPDAVNLAGIVLKGAAVGGQVGGAIWQNPAIKLAKTDPGYPGHLNSGYAVDFANLIPCADGTPGNASVAQVLFGGGGATSTSAIGTAGVPGVAFFHGQP